MPKPGLLGAGLLVAKSELNWTILDTAPQIIQSIHVTQFFSWRNEGRLLANPVLQQYFIIGRCEIHPMDIYSIVQTIEENVQLTFCLHSIAPHRLRFSVTSPDYTAVSVIILIRKLKDG